MKTFLKWQGNKSKHISKIEKYLPEEIFDKNWSGTYIEPFIGSGAMLLYIEPEKWIINDLNKDLINIWKSVKNTPEKLINLIKTFGKKFKPLSNEQKLNLCTKMTNNISNTEYNDKRASMYLLMNNCAYMGNIFIKNKYKFASLNMSIKNNTYSFLSEKYYDNLLDISEYLNETKGIIYNKDYKIILAKAKKGDFVFLDPPYIEEINYKFNYNKDEVLNEDFIDTLVKEMNYLDKKNVKWIMTQADTKMIRLKFKKYNIKVFKVYRITKKGYVNELLIMNY